MSKRAGHTAKVARQKAAVLRLSEAVKKRIEAGLDPMPVQIILDNTLRKLGSNVPG